MLSEAERKKLLREKQIYLDELLKHLEEEYENFRLTVDALMDHPYFTGSLSPQEIWRTNLLNEVIADKVADIRRIRDSEPMLNIESQDKFRQAAEVVKKLAAEQQEIGIFIEGIVARFPKMRVTLLHWYFMPWETLRHLALAVHGRIAVVQIRAKRLLGVRRRRLMSQKINSQPA